MVGYEKKECLILIFSVTGSFHNGSAVETFSHNSEKNGRNARVTQLMDEEHYNKKPSKNPIRLVSTPLSDTPPGKLESFSR